jgi:hypothetical protein
VDGTLYTLGDYGIPTLKTNARNGLPAVHFDDDKQQVLLSETWSWDASQGLTVFTVCTGGTGDIQRVVSLGKSGGEAHKSFSCDVSSLQSGARYNNGYCLGNSPFTYGKWHTSVRRIAQGASYADLYYRVNDTRFLETISNYPDRYVNFDAAGNDITVGAGWQTDMLLDWYDGDVAEIVVYNKQLSEAQIQTVMLYLDEKYDLFYLPGDFEPDADVDLDDLTVLANQWLSSGDDLAADIHPSEGDGTVNFADFAEFARYWMRVSE